MGDPDSDMKRIQRDVELNMVKNNIEEYASYLRNLSENYFEFINLKRTFEELGYIVEINHISKKIKVYKEL